MQSCSKISAEEVSATHHVLRETIAEKKAILEQKEVQQHLREEL